MSMDVTSSMAGAALGLRQAMGQVDFGVKAMNRTADAEQATLTTLLEGAASGGNVTETRGRNVNILV